MLISLTIVILAAVLASVALFFLLGAKVDDFKKQNILIIVGSLILLSILISNFKSNDMFTFSLLNSVTKNKIHSMFANQLPPYNHKYQIDPKTLGDYLYQKNYAFNPKDKDYNQCIIYLSNKEEGASFFLYQLTQKMRAQGYPAFYVKMQSPSASSQQFFRKTGLYSFDAFKSAIQYYSQQKLKPYIIVDNAELLPRPIWDILASYDEGRGLHIILNTQNPDTLYQRISQIDRTSRALGQGDSFLRRFQIQKFNMPDQSTLQKLTPSNSFVKKIALNFQNIFHLKNGHSQQQIVMKSTNVNNNVASYFGLTSYFNQIKRILERGPTHFGKLRQTNVPFQIIQQMQRLRLINIQNGQVQLI